MNYNVGLFSEGDSYYSTFYPIVQEFIDRRQEIIYFTLDKNDKILEIDSPFLKNKFLGNKFFSILNFYFIDVDNLISTTPNIGCKNYPYRKPFKVKNLIHIFHSVSDISIYRVGSLDYYDSVFLTGNFQKKSILELESKRKTIKKKLVCVGAPYLDYLIHNKLDIKNTDKINTVLIASSWGTKGCLENYGSSFIKKIAKKYKVILRPHPYSLIFEKDKIEYLKKELKETNIIWDFEIDPSSSMSIADILISDTSSIRFDFSLVYNKPVITLSVDSNMMSGYERECLDYDWIK